MRKLVIAFGLLAFAMGCANRSAPEPQRSAKVEVVRHTESPKGVQTVMAPPK